MVEAVAHDTYAFSGDEVTLLVGVASHILEQGILGVQMTDKIRTLLAEINTAMEYEESTSRSNPQAQADVVYGKCHGLNPQCECAECNNYRDFVTTTKLQHEVNHDLLVARIKSSDDYDAQDERFGSWIKP